MNEYMHLSQMNINEIMQQKDIETVNEMEKYVGSIVGKNVKINGRISWEPSEIDTNCEIINNSKKHELLQIKNYMRDTYNISDGKYAIFGLTGHINNYVIKTDSVIRIAIYDKTLYEIINNANINNNNNNKIEIIKTLYNSIDDILLNIDNINERFIYNAENDKYMGTTMFYINLMKIRDNSMSDKNRYANNIVMMRQENDIHYMIATCDDNRLRQYKLSNTVNNNKIKNGYTGIEYAIIKYGKTKNKILKLALINIIKELCNYKYMRHPYIIVKYLGLTRITEMIHDIETDYDSVNMRTVNNIIDKYRNSSLSMENIINIVMLEILIKNNDSKTVLEYMEYTNSYSLIDKIIIENRDNIREIILILNKRRDNININIINNICVNYGFIDIIMENKMIIDNNMLKTYISNMIKTNNYIMMLYLLKTTCDAIKDTVSENHNYEDLYNKFKTDKIAFMKIIELFNKYNACIYRTKYNTILHYIAKIHDNIINIKELAKKLNIDISEQDTEGNTVGHILAASRNGQFIDIIDNINNKILNIQNKDGETISIILAKHLNEEALGIISKYEYDDTIQDKYGNTVYHYMCMNNIMINKNIKNNIANKYGFLPLDYTYMKLYYKV